MDGFFASAGLIGILANLVIIVLWLLVPFFIFLISRRVKEMRDLARESSMEIRELNANINYLKRKYSDSNHQDL